MAPLFFVGKEMSKEDQSHLIARFYVHPVLDVEKSQETGRKIERRVDYVELRVKGDKNASFSRPVSEQDQEDFPDAWKRFKKEGGDHGAYAGIGVAMLPGIAIGQVDELQELGVITIEDLANLLDVHASKMKEGMTLKNRAKAYLVKLDDLKDATKLDALAKLQAENDVLKERILELETQPAKRRA